MPSSRVQSFYCIPWRVSQIFVTAQAPCGPQLSAVRAAPAERDGATALTPSPAAQHWPPPPSEQGSPPLPSRVSPAQALATSASGLCSQEGRHHHLLLLGMWLPSASFFLAPCSTCPPPKGPGPPPRTPCIAARAWHYALCGLLPALYLYFFGARLRRARQARSRHRPLASRVPGRVCMLS